MPQVGGDIRPSDGLPVQFVHDVDHGTFPGFKSPSFTGNVLMVINCWVKVPNSKEMMVTMEAVYASQLRRDVRTSNSDLKAMETSPSPEMSQQHQASPCASAAHQHRCLHSLVKGEQLTLKHHPRPSDPSIAHVDPWRARAMPPDSKPKQLGSGARLAQWYSTKQ